MRLARREFLQAFAIPVIFRPGRRLRMTLAAPGRPAASWTLRAAEARGRARECLRGGSLGRVVFVSYSTDAGPWRFSIHGAEATLTLEEAA